MNDPTEPESTACDQSTQCPSNTSGNPGTSGDPATMGTPLGRTDSTSDHPLQRDIEEEGEWNDSGDEDFVTSSDPEQKKLPSSKRNSLNDRPSQV